MFEIGEINLLVKGFCGSFKGEVGVVYLRMLITGTIFPTNSLLI